MRRKLPILVFLLVVATVCLVAILERRGARRPAPQDPRALNQEQQQARGALDLVATQDSGGGPGKVPLDSQTVDFVGTDRAVAQTSVVLRFTAKTPGGRPCPNAAVSVRSQLGQLAEGITDARGHVRFEVEASVPPPAFVRAESPRSDPGSVGELRLDAPLVAGEWSLNLVPTGTLEVLTTDALGTALPGVSVQLRGTDREDRVLTWALTTNARGEALFEGVPGGTFEISLADPRTKQETKAKVNLIGGGKERKEFALSHPEERLAAAGLVVDERGGAVGDVELSATAEKKWYRFRSDQEGRFEFWLLPCERVRVLAPFQYPGMGGLNGPIYEPQEFEIPFGTNGLIFRRVGELELVEGMVTAVDRRTGKPVPGAFLRYEQTEPRPLTHTSSGNPVRLACYLVPSTRWAVHAPGYRTRYGLLAELLATEIVHEQPESGPDTLDSSNLLWGGRVFRVEMDLGFEREVAVLDAATKRPIRKAHFVAEDGAVFLTNSEGLVVLTAEQPSKHYIIQADGYERMEWDPDVAKSASRTILLTPRQD